MMKFEAALTFLRVGDPYSALAMLDYLNQNNVATSKQQCIDMAHPVSLTTYLSN
jgi:hypothetical protein